MRVPVLTVLLFITLRPGIEAIVLQEPTIKKQVNEYIELLKSDDEAKKKEGKEKLLQLGDESISPLLALLEALIQYHWSLPEQEFNLISLLGPRDKRSSLQNNIMELLGRLHAERAVPLLIRSIEEREVDNFIEKMRPDMDALIAIGSAAVPNLIEEIKEAETMAKRYAQGAPASRIQVRAAIVLGQIGDVRALPVLEELYEQRKDKLVQRAIEQIKTKNNLK